MHCIHTFCSSKQLLQKKDIQYILRFIYIIYTWFFMHFNVFVMGKISVKKHAQPSGNASVQRKVNIKRRAARLATWSTLAIVQVTWSPSHTVCIFSTVALIQSDCLVGVSVPHTWKLWWRAEGTVRAGAFPPIALIFRNIFWNREWNGAIDNFVPLERCILMTFPSACVWNYSKTSPLLYGFNTVVGLFGGTSAESEGYSQDQRVLSVPGSSCLEIRIKCNLFFWLAGRGSLGAGVQIYSSRISTSETKVNRKHRVGDLHRIAEVPRKSTVVAVANNKFTVLCCT